MEREDGFITLKELYLREQARNFPTLGSIPVMENNNRVLENNNPANGDVPILDDGETVSDEELDESLPLGQRSPEDDREERERQQEEARNEEAQTEDLMNDVGNIVGTYKDLIKEQESSESGTNPKDNSKNISPKINKQVSQKERNARALIKEFIVNNITPSPREMEEIQKIYSKIIRV